LLLSISTKRVFACYPEADFSVDETNPVVGENITFTDASTNAAGWTWNFGNNATPATVNGVGPHNVYYTATGQKTVELTVTGFGSDTKTNNINVGLPPTPGEIGYNQDICSGEPPGLLVSVTDGGGSVNTSIEYEWETDASGGWATISGETGSTYQPPSLTNTTSYRRRTVTDWGGSIRYSGYTNVVTVVVDSPSATVTQYTPDNECPQLDPNLGFEPNNDGPYNAGSSEIQFQVQNNSPTATWSFDFEITDANGLTGFVVDSVNAAGNSSYNQDILNSSGTFNSIPAADDLITITARVKNIPGEQIEVDFNLTNISDSNGCSTDYSANRDTVIMNVMPVVGQFE
jgi:PKD repeat protein